MAESEETETRVEEFTLMFFPVESLAKRASRSVDLWKKQLVTKTETIGGILDDAVQTLADNPGQENLIAAIIDALPLEIVEGMAERINRRDPDGQWEWVTGCDVLADPPPYPGYPKNKPETHPESAAWLRAYLKKKADQPDP